MDIQKTHKMLLEAGLPSTVEDLKNPTKEYVVELITSFLRFCNIDVEAAMRPSLNQISEHHTEITKLINLRRTLAPLCGYLAITEFTLSDIVSPVSKRTRSLAYRLANFMLYVQNKRAEVQDRVNSVEEKVKEMEKLKNELQKLTTESNDLAIQNTKQLKSKKKLMNQIKELESQKGVMVKKVQEVETEKGALREKKLIVTETCNTLKSDFQKSLARKKDLQMKIVNSPENFEKQLAKLKNQKMEKEATRDATENALKDRQQLIQRYDDICKMVQQLHNDLSDANTQCNTLKERKKKFQVLKEQYKTQKLAIIQLQEELSKQDVHDSTAEISNYQKQLEMNLEQLSKQVQQLESHKKSVQAELAEKTTHSRKIKQQNQKEEQYIKELEEMIASLLKAAQENYNEIIAEEKAV